MVQRRIRLILALASLLVLVGCRPKGVLSARQIEVIAYDLHRTDAILNLAGYDHAGYEEASAKYYYETLARHGVTQAQWDSSIMWYTAHPGRYDKIYPKIVARIDADIEAATAAAEAERLAREGEAALPRNELRDLRIVMAEYRFGMWLWY